MVRLRGFQTLATVERALEIFFRTLRIEKLRTAIVPLDLALNRVLATPLVAKEDLPRFDRAAVDGYALRAEDIARASESRPRIVKKTYEDEICKGQTKEVWTGSRVPNGADAIAMLENANDFGDRVEIAISLTSGSNISKKGEDYKKGSVALRTGTRLRPHHIGLIAALGTSKVKVYERPKVAILATGNELIEAGNKPNQNQIFDASRHIVLAMCRELGAETWDLGISVDNPESIIARLKNGLHADMIITTGGTSVGALDFVPEAMDALGRPGVIVHGVAMRPAMPTALGIINGKPIIALSGNPVAAIIGFEVFARPTICRMLGTEPEPRPQIKANLTKKIPSTLGRKTFVRVRILKHKTEFLAEPVSTKGSGLISTMTRANGYFVIPENREGMERGETVTVHMFDNAEIINENV